MIKKEMIAMLLAGGQGSRLGVLTHTSAKPAMAFGGKYRIIDFPLSNCINSGVDTVGVLTQYQPLALNHHIGIGMPWDLDRNVGGVTVLPPYEQNEGAAWYSGTANAIWQNMAYMEHYHPEYVLILSGDHIYKMDYGLMLDFHKKSGAEATIATMPVPWEEASRFGIMVAEPNGRITRFEEKPENPSSNLASMGIYIFNFQTLKKSLSSLYKQENLDFGKHVIPYLHDSGHALYAFEFNGYWKDVGTLGSYWDANMELVDILPEFNLYEEYWKIYTNSTALPPQYLSEDAVTDRALICNGCEIYGRVEHSVIGANVTVGRGSVVKDSIIMQNTQIGENCEIYRAILGDDCRIEAGTKIGVGEPKPNEEKPHIYAFNLAVLGNGTVVPAGITIGTNTAVLGETVREDYAEGLLPSGKNLFKEPPSPAKEEKEADTKNEAKPAAKEGVSA